jgi:hypothetical protein
MEVYERETQEIVGRFLQHRISFLECIAALDAALADLLTRLTGDQATRHASEQRNCHEGIRAAWAAGKGKVRA